LRSEFFHMLFYGDSCDSQAAARALTFKLK
jgi:hypothetical protein